MATLALLSLSLLGLTSATTLDGSAASAASPLSTAPLAGYQDRQPIDLAAAPGGLREVPKEFRPKVRWWWPRIDVDEAEIKRELVAVEQAGFGGVEQVLMRDFDGWETALFRENIKYALSVATDLGLSFDVTLGPGWPMSAPSADDFDKHLSMQDLVHGTVDVVGPATVGLPLPAPPENGGRSLRFVALTAAQVDPAAPSVENGAVALDPDSMRDISKTVSGSSFSWTPPAGAWRVFAFYMRPTGQRPHASQKSTVLSTGLGQAPIDAPRLPNDVNEGSLVVDHFSREATMAAVKDYDRMLFGNDMDALWRRSNGMVFEDSIEIGHAGPGSSVALPYTPELRPFWTRDLRREFARRRGYDITRLLPATLPEYGLSDGGGARVKRDLRDTLQDLWIDNHMRPIAEWAESHGMRTRQQAYGFFGFDAVRGAVGAQHPDAETLGFGDPAIVGPEVVLPGANYSAWGSPEGWKAMDRYREVSSGAHLSGADIVSNEWGAALQGNYNMQPTDYVALANRAMSVGVSSQILHGFSYKDFNEEFSPPWPGWCTWCEPGFAFADSWNQDWPQWPSWRSVTDYIGRAQAVLRQGDPRVDLTVLGGAADASDFGVPLAQRGFTYDFVDQETAAGLPLARGQRLLPDGPAYKALVVTGQTTMRGSTAARVLELARSGLPVVVYSEPPRAGSGYADAQAEDMTVKESFVRLLELPNVRRASNAAALTEALESLQVQPDFRTAQPSGVVPLHRRTASGDIWFLYNHGTTAVRTTATLAAEGTPFRVDLLTGEASQAGAYRTTARSLELPLHLLPGQTSALVVRRSAPPVHATSTTADDAVIAGRDLVLTSERGGLVTTRLSDGREVVRKLPAAPAPIRLEGPWQVEAKLFNPEGPRTQSVTMERLTDWREVPELRGQSGQASYSTTFSVPRSWIDPDLALTVDLGAVAGSAEVLVNGSLVPGLSAFSGRRQITSGLRAGENKIVVHLATTYLNKIAELARSGDPRYALFNSKVPEASGLLGPVTLVASPRTTLRLGNAEGRGDEQGPSSAPAPLGAERGTLPATGSQTLWHWLAFVLLGAGLLRLRGRSIGRSAWSVAGGRAFFRRRSESTRPARRT